MSYIFKKLLNALLFCHRYLFSPAFNAMGFYCRYTPSCSNYCRQAVDRHGVGLGLFLTTKRILRCSPLFRGGWDPVPETVSFFSIKRNKRRQS